MQISEVLILSNCNEQVVPNNFQCVTFFISKSDILAGNRQKINSSLRLRYYDVTCNEWRGLSTRPSAWATQLRRNTAGTASAVGDALSHWTSSVIKPKPPAPIAMSLITTTMHRLFSNIIGVS